MPPRPFPFALSIGNDICRVGRIHRLISRPKEPHLPASPLLHFMNKFLTHREQTDFWAKFKQMPSVANPTFDALAQHLAGRWAAKEAAIKAVRHRKLTLMDIEILRYRGPGGVGGIFGLIRDKPGSPRPNEENREQISASPIRYTGQRNHVKAFLEAERTPKDPSADGAAEPDPMSLYGELEGQIVKISISHDGDYATAVCLAPEEPMIGDVGGEAAARMS